MPDLGPDLGLDIGPDVAPALLAAPVPAGAAPTSAGAILAAVVFTFALQTSQGAAQSLLLGPNASPDLGPDTGPDVDGGAVVDNGDLAPAVSQTQNAGNQAGQTVSVQMLDGGGQPFQDYQPGLTVDLGAGQYGASFSVPPGFTGFARAILTSGLTLGQTDTQPVNLGAALDLSDVAWTLGRPQTSVFDPASNTLVAGSDGFLHVLVSGFRSEDGTPVDPTGNPVALAVTSGAASPGDFQVADWLTVTGPPSAAGTYARLALSAAAGNALAYGNYRVTLQINGTTTLRAPSYVLVS